MAKSARLRLAATWLVTAVVTAAGCRPASSPPAWTLAPESAIRTGDQALLARIGKALDAAERAGTDPSISQFHVRAATVVSVDGAEHVVVGGNTEYPWPQAVHGEVSVMNHVITQFGADAARRVPFIAFHSQSCGDSRGCGDCRDYLKATTDYNTLMLVCGRATDRTIHIRKLADGLVDEEQFADASFETAGLPRADLERLLAAARTARSAFWSTEAESKASSAADVPCSPSTCAACVRSSLARCCWSSATSTGASSARPCTASAVAPPRRATLSGSASTRAPRASSAAWSP